MSDNGSGNDQTRSARRGFAIIIAFLVIIVILVGVIAFLLGRNTGSSDNSSEASNTPSSREVVNESRVILDEESATGVMDEMRSAVAEGMFECNMSMTWTFEDTTKPSKDAYVANSSNNTHPIYFDVVLKDTGETVYSSPILPVGSELKNFALDKSLEPGTYKATVKYTLLRDEESQEIISSAGFVIKIKVSN
ncbi:hypothetical protein [Butyrivibrio proteoclasticus]|uniref:hypothetical protein n=1 Tax=Butyrivibrio proteoclasticus TaxID=43305 RepID=UPI000A7083E0|nr:hypothetical protein [Butyrivibrio proteoclasticus]